MKINPVNVAAIAESVVNMLKRWPDLDQADVTRGEWINEDPTRCPWVGIYPIGIQYPIRALGLGAGFRRQQISLVAVTQQQTDSSDDGSVCMDLLEELNQRVISCLLSDPSLGGMVSTIDNFSVQYASAKTQADAPNFQSAIINFTGEISVTGG